MGDLLRQGSQWLAGVLSRHAASPVTYSRPVSGGGDLVELPVAATLGKTDCEKPDEYGLPVGATATDFLVVDAEFTATFGEPTIGDRIATDDDAVYEVLELPGQGCWRWTDGFGSLLRIHTKRIGAE